MVAVSIVGASVRQPWPVWRQDATGEPVRSLQYLLDVHGAALVVDGKFGPRTHAAVIAFQPSHGQAVTGWSDRRPG
jgi:peptidoglycan hydrolase-like protein with peptidoglycan-binding domain